jgi:phenolic acid decarboxylase
MTMENSGGQGLLSLFFMVAFVWVEMETAALNAKLPPRIQHKLDYYARETSARNRWPKEQTIHLKGHTKAVVGVRWSPTHGAPVSRSMTANLFTSQLWCYVYNNVLFFIERERERALCNDQITDFSKVLMHRMKGRGKRGGGRGRETG